MVGSGVSIILVVLAKNKRKKAYLNISGSKIEIKTCVTIGRIPINLITLNDSKVSRNHAKINKVGKEYILTDLNSRNGTYVNGVKVSSQILTNGDTIKIGNNLIIFSFE